MMKLVLVLSLFVALTACGQNETNILLKSADVAKFEEKILEVEVMIAKYKDVLNRMNHESNLTASKLIGDRHRYLKNFIRIANNEQKIDLSHHFEMLSDAETFYKNFAQNVKIRN